MPGGRCGLYPGIERKHQTEEHKKREAENSILRDVGRDRLLELAKAEKEARLIVLPPVKVGDEAFFIIKKQIFSGEVYYLRWENHKSFGVRGDISADCVGGCIGARLSDFGKTVFLTREEAEAALKEQEG